MLGVIFLPLIALGLLQTTIAALLLAPLALARPVIKIMKQTRSPAGWTVTATISVILVAFLISALYEIAEVHGHARKGSGESEIMHRRCDDTHYPSGAGPKELRTCWRPVAICSISKMRSWLTVSCMHSDSTITGPSCTADKPR